MGRKNRRKNEQPGRLRLPAAPLTPRRMEIWYARLRTPDWSRVQGGTRPVVIVSNDTANVYSPVITVVPMTSRMKKLIQPTHVLLTPDDCEGIRCESLALAEQVTSIDKTQLLDRRGRVVSPRARREITDALQVQIGAG